MCCCFLNNRCSRRSCSDHCRGGWSVSIGVGFIAVNMGGGSEDVDGCNFTESNLVPSLMFRWRHQKKALRSASLVEWDWFRHKTALPAKHQWSSLFYFHILFYYIVLSTFVCLFVCFFLSFYVPSLSHFLSFFLFFFLSFHYLSLFSLFLSLSFLYPFSFFFSFLVFFSFHPSFATLFNFPFRFLRLFFHTIISIFSSISCGRETLK